MSKKFQLKKILILVTLLVVPGFLYYLLQYKAKNRYLPLAFFGPKKVAQTYHMRRGEKIPDTIYHQISDFKLSDQNGDTIAYKGGTNTISVFNFFYTRCASCDQNNQRLERLVRQYEDNKMLHFYSITVDPASDSPQVLRQYAASYHTPPKKWLFLTGNKEEIYKLAGTDFLIDVMPDPERPGNILHNPVFILVDSHKRIRGYYDPASREEMDKLTDEIKVLIAEELRNSASSLSIE